MTSSNSETAPGSRSMAVLVRWLLAELAAIILTTLAMLHSAVSHQWLAAVLFGFSLMFWILFAWGDLHRWTGPANYRHFRSVK